MSSPYQPSRRAVYRVVYPEEQRPTFHVGGATHQVIDCSELGLRYRIANGHVPEVGTTMQGHVRFRRGSEVAVAGEIIRVDPDSVALWFSARGIPLSEVLAERAWLARPEPPG
jgi:hypothetical protein